MTTLAQENPVRAIRNALERLARLSSGTQLEEHVAAERAIVESALVVLEKGSATIEVRRCSRCGRACGETSCEWCDLFGAG